MNGIGHSSTYLANGSTNGSVVSIDKAGEKVPHTPTPIPAPRTKERLRSLDTLRG